MTRVAIYARYSSELQSERSIDDQIAVCRDRVHSEGWSVTEIYTDYALSGATMNRPGLKALMDDARAGTIDVLVTEALDRLSRDQEDIAGIFKRLTAWQVAIVTLGEGTISELHVGLKGTMNALFLKDLAAKSLRGQIGKAREGKAAGGIPFGYEVVREIGPDGELIRGNRRIVPEKAEVIRRIYREFAAGRSTVAIAKGLNADCIPAPRGGLWNPSTIQGHRKRGVGLLTNPLYIGRQVFNRHAFVRDPDSGSRRARPKDKKDWIETDVPDLAIVDKALWQAVQERIAATPVRERPETHRRPKRLFSGLIECGICGGNITIAWKDRYGCPNARQKGNCHNNRTMPAPAIERLVLDGLRDKLLDGDLIQTFVTEFHAELQRHQKDRKRQQRASIKERTSLERKIERLVDAIADGTAGEIPSITNKLRELEARVRQLPPEAETMDMPVEWHPSAAGLYRQKVANLQESLNADDLTRDEATAVLRGLIEKIVVYPAEKRGLFDLELHGHLAAILNMGQGTKKPGNVGGAGSLLRTRLSRVFPVNTQEQGISIIFPRNIAPHTPRTSRFPWGSSPIPSAEEQGIFLDKQGIGTPDQGIDRYRTGAGAERRFAVFVRGRCRLSSSSHLFASLPRIGGNAGFQAAAHALGTIPNPGYDCPAPARQHLFFRPVEQGLNRDTPPSGGIVVGFIQGKRDFSV